MADEVPAIAPVPVAAPAADATPPAPAPVAAPAPAPAPEAAPPADALAPAPEASAEAPKPDAEPPKPEAPKYEFKFADTVKPQPEQVSAYSNILAKHNISPEAGKELVDFYGHNITAMQDAMAQQQQDVFAETRRSWQNDFYKQAGNRRDTILNDAKFAVGQILPDKKQREAFWEVLNYTGLGDHPANIMAWAKVGRVLRERAAPVDGQPNNPQNSQRPEDKRYGNKAGPRT